MNLPKTRKCIISSEKNRFIPDSTARATIPDIHKGKERHKAIMVQALILFTGLQPPVHPLPVQQESGLHKHIGRSADSLDIR